MKKILLLICGLALISIIVILALYLKIYASDEWSFNINEWSGFGNFIGGTLSPLLAFLALIALLFSINYQIDEFDKTNNHLSNQNNLLQKQSVEATYFQLLKLLNETVKGTSIEIITSNHEKLSFKNKEVFHELVRQFNHLRDISATKNEKEVYKRFKEKYEGILSYYYELISLILKFIDNNSFLSDQEKITFASILRAQFSIYEQVIINYDLQYGGAIECILINKYQIICSSSTEFKSAANIRRSNAL